MKTTYIKHLKYYLQTIKDENSIHLAQSIKKLDFYNNLLKKNVVEQHNENVF